MIPAAGCDLPLLQNQNLILVAATDSDASRTGARDAMYADGKTEEPSTNVATTRAAANDGRQDMVGTCLAVRSRKLSSPFTGSSDLALSRPIEVPRPPLSLSTTVSGRYFSPPLRVATRVLFCFVYFGLWVQVSGEQTGEK